MEFDTVVIHYGEIGIKGKNRPFFEKVLLDNVKMHLKRFRGLKVRRISGRLIVEIAEDLNLEELRKELLKIHGIHHFSFSKSCPLDIEEIKRVTVEFAKEYSQNESFRVECVRANKKFEISSQEVNKIVGEEISRKRNLKVNLKHPDHTIFIEICEEKAYVYDNKIYGLKGLPVGVSGKVIALISGGIDSPVASFLAMKRGCRVVFVHFFNITGHSSGVKGKVERIVRVLNEYQRNSKLYLVPFRDVQMELIKKVPSKYRMLIYRRFMFRIASEIAEKENAKALVVGDSISQVASQTLENLNAVYNTSRLVVLPPLIGMDKEEIIEMAKKLGTYEISIEPYEDCCSFMIAKHPETKGDIKIIEEIESHIDIEELVKKCLESIIVIDFHES
jgi:thiamine biosynthesis protein ThiI